MKNVFIGIIYIVFGLLLGIVAIGLSGCGSELATGTVLGAAGVGTLEGVLDYYQAQTADSLLRLDEAQKKLDVASNETEREALQAEINSLKDDVLRMSQEREVIEKSKEIVTSDWSTSAGVASGAALISNLLTVLYFNRKKKKDM